VASEGGLALAHGRALALSAREYAVLLTLVRRRGRIVSREELYRLVWGSELRPGDRSVDVYVSKLRGKLESELPEERFIHTHVRFGYRLDPEPAAPKSWAASASPITQPRTNSQSQTSRRGRKGRPRAGRPRPVPQTNDKER
jgi:DNA-binding winged helix-turn-helix (wHTH) protein